MNSFLKKVKGLFCENSTLEHETLENFVNQQVQSLFSSPKTSETFLYEQVFSKFPLQLEETKKIIINELNRVFLEKSTDRQKINLRKLTLETKDIRDIHDKKCQGGKRRFPLTCPDAAGG